MRQDHFFKSPPFKFTLLIILLFLCWQMGRRLPLDVDAYREWLSQFPLFISGFVFVVVYVVVTFFVFFANDLFRMMSAVLFGPYVSTVFVWAAEMMNLLVLFNLSRNLGREFVEQKFKWKEDRQELKAEDPFWGIFVIRVAPLVPFRFLDLGFGLTQISLKRYFVISLVSSPLRIFWVQFILAGVGDMIFKDPSVLVEYLSNNRIVFNFSLIYIVFTFVGVFLYRKRKKKAA